MKKFILIGTVFFLMDYSLEAGGRESKEVIVYREQKDEHRDGTFLKKQLKFEKKYRAHVRRKASFLDIVSFCGLFSCGKTYREKHRYELNALPAGTSR